MSFTTMKELYDVLCEVSEKVTGRPTWSRPGIQATPNYPYATVYIMQGAIQTNEVVQIVDRTAVDDEPTLREVVWGTVRLDIEIEYYKDATVSTALNAATQFKNCLHREARNYDLWLICGFAGDVRFIDMSQIFRADTESRVKIMFSVYANVQEIANDTDSALFEIDTQTVNADLNGTTFSTTAIKPT